MGGDRDAVEAALHLEALVVAGESDDGLRGRLDQAL